MAEFLLRELVSWHRFHGRFHSLSMKLPFFIAGFMASFIAAFQAAPFHGQFHNNIYLVEMSDAHRIRMVHGLLLRALPLPDWRLFCILT